jgi:hypothetical protein
MIDEARVIDEATFPVSVSARSYSGREAEAVAPRTVVRHPVPLHAELAAVLGAVKARPGSVACDARVERRPSLTAPARVGVAGAQGRDGRMASIEPKDCQQVGGSPLTALRKRNGSVSGFRFPSILRSVGSGNGSDDYDLSR